MRLMNPSPRCKVLFRPRLLQEETFAVDVFHAGGIQPARRSTFDKVDDEVLNAAEAVKAAEAVAAVRDDEMQTVGKVFGRRLAVDGRRHRIPLARENQRGHA